MNITKNDLEVSEDLDAAPCSCVDVTAKYKVSQVILTRELEKKVRLNRSTQPMGLTNAACQGLRLIRQVLPPSSPAERKELNLLRT